MSVLKLKLKMQIITFYVAKITYHFSHPHEDLKNIDNAIAYLNSNDLVRVILYGDKSFDKKN